MAPVEEADPGREGLGASAVRDAALGFVARGWSVVAGEPRGKRPLLPWLEFQRRRATPAEIDRWFGRWPRANVAIVTGALSGLVVLDVDPRHGGAESLAQLEIDHGPLARTVEATTGGGGRHLYFEHPGGQVSNRAALAPGLDLRGDGGCVVAPPSESALGAAVGTRAGRADPPHACTLARPRARGGGRRFTQCDGGFTRRALALARRRSRSSRRAAPRLEPGALPTAASRRRGPQLRLQHPAHASTC